MNVVVLIFHLENYQYELYVIEDGQDLPKESIRKCNLKEIFTNRAFTWDKDKNPFEAVLIHTFNTPVRDVIGIFENRPFCQHIINVVYYMNGILKILGVVPSLTRFKRCLNSRKPLQLIIRYTQNIYYCSQLNLCNLEKTFYETTTLIMVSYIYIGLNINLLQ